jgi:hypothetical protein
MTPRRAYTRTGYHALRARVKVAGLAAIDRRTHGARALLDWRRDLIGDLGGEDAVTAQQRALVDVATRTKLYVDHLDAWLMEQRSLVNAKKKAAHPVLLQRQQLADALARYMAQLGLERRARPVPTLSTYIEDRYGHEGAPTTREQAVRERNEEPR